MRSRIFCVGLAVASFTLLAGGLVQADTITQSFDTDSTNMSATYPQYDYALGNGSATVSGNVLYIQDRSDGDFDDIRKYTLMMTKTTYTKDPVAGKLIVDVDLGAVPYDGGVGRLTHGVFFGDPDGNWVSFAYHPGYAGEGFFVENNDWSRAWSNPGFTPVTGILQQHMRVEYDGVDTFDVTFSQGASSHVIQYVDSRIGSDASLGLFARNGAGWGTANFDNFTITGAPVPEPGSIAIILTGIIGLLAYAWRKRR